MKIKAKRSMKEKRKKKNVRSHKARTTIKKQSAKGIFCFCLTLRDGPPRFRGKLGHRGDLAHDVSGLCVLLKSGLLC